jgi:hypothetical protein
MRSRSLAEKNYSNNIRQWAVWAWAGIQNMTGRWMDVLWFIDYTLTSLYIPIIKNYNEFLPKSAHKLAHKLRHAN